MTFVREFELAGCADVLPSRAMNLESATGGIGPVASSRLGTQPVGEVAEVAGGVYQLKLPVPLPLRFISVYLIEGSGGWTVVDAGFDYPPTYEAWEKAATTLGIDLAKDIERIVVTHFHPDHLGAARALQERSGAPVMMLEDEIEFSRRIWNRRDGPEPFIEHLIQHGMPRGTAVEASTALRSGLALPEVLMPLRVGEKLSVGGGAVRVLHAPGHADHQLILHDEAREILYAADHVLLKITPNVGLWPENLPHPLARYLDSLESLRGLNVDLLVLPGHGPVFHDLHGRIDELIRHHDERLELMRSVISNEPKTAFEVSAAVFRDDLSIYEQCFALAETLAHLDHLELEGRAERVGDKPVLYRAL